MAQAKNDNTALATPPMIVLPRTRVIPDDRYAGMKDRQAALAFRVMMRIGGGAAHHCRPC
jgi:hypothetical protein